ncbi:hypothetical protein LOTGIDRAFT_145572 [Lottia gigantea]|uniref:McKusick-Kaufman/Bardet-Biedl syndromes chaperonin n=1 Tax=Lottia gigantea TaxID=225164 RepID=V4AFV8_LOTGI|nr:hypothetical protein LOTGIDRAFT_145572 [Lottia gigantea]ESO92286.1 hypothetical protein LOTGIDRAFT_145572 [Lottia gigantea]
MGSIEAAKNQSNLQVDTLDDPEVKASLATLRQIVSSCMGPHGKIKIIQNASGGPITRTTTSSRLFNSISLSKPVLKLVVNSVKSHVDQFQDGGLMACLFCLLLVESSVESDINRSILADLFQVFYEIIDDYLSSEECACKYEMDFSNLDAMMAFVQNMYDSKPFCGLYGYQLEEFSRLILQTFLQCIPDMASSKASFYTTRIYLLCVKHEDMNFSQNLSGLVLEYPELSSLNEKKLSVKRSLDSVDCDRIKVALINCSMSGDVESELNANCEVATGMDPDLFFTEKILSFCYQLVTKEVGLVLCQKVMHPRVKDYLRSKGVLFIDRLGAMPIPYVQDVTGASPIGLLTDGPSDGMFGWLDQVEHLVINNQSYLHLQEVDSCIITLVLATPEDDKLDELKTTTLGVLRNLERLIIQPEVLFGGGCWNTHIAAYLRHHVQENMESIAESHDCMESMVTTAADMFAKCLEKIAMVTSPEGMDHLIDLTNYHVWRVPKGEIKDTSSIVKSSSIKCGCNVFDSTTVSDFRFEREKVAAKVSKFDPTRLNADGISCYIVSDSLAVVNNALRIAINTASSIITMGQFIHDTN